MNGSHFHVYARTHEPSRLTEAVKKTPKLRQAAYWYAGRPEEFRWIVKQSELLRFVERLLRLDVEEIRIEASLTEGEMKRTNRAKPKPGSLKSSRSMRDDAWEPLKERF